PSTLDTIGVCVLFCRDKRDRKPLRLTLFDALPTSQILGVVKCRLIGLTGSRLASPNGHSAWVFVVWRLPALALGMVLSRVPPQVLEQVCRPAADEGVDCRPFELKARREVGCRDQLVGRRVTSLSSSRSRLGGRAGCTVRWLGHRDEGGPGV